MIINFLFNLLATLLSFIFQQLPTVTSFPYGIDTYILQVYGFVHAMALIFPPASTFINLFLFGISIEIAFKIYQLIMKIIHLVRGSG